MNALRITLLYALLATLWIAGSDILVHYLVVDLDQLGQFQFAKGLLFVALTASLLYLHLTRSARFGPRQEPVPTQQQGKRRLWLLIALFFLAVPVIDGFIYLEEAPRLDRNAFGYLTSTAELKSKQVESWLLERRRDGSSLVKDPTFVAQTQHLIDHPGDRAEQSLRHRLATFMAVYRYRSVSLTQRDGSPLVELELATEADPGPTSNAQSAAEHPASVVVYHREREGLADVSLGHHTHGTEGFHLHLGFPVGGSDDGERIATLHLKVAPKNFLFPYISQWSSDSASGETLLVARDEERVRFLTPLRHSPGEPDSITHAIADSRLPAAVALRDGGKGVVRGLDYRGTDVLAAHHPVAGTDWQLIAKLDRREVMAPLYTLLGWTTLITMVAAVLTATLLTRIWRQQERLASLSLAEERRRSNELIRQFFDLPFIGIAFTDPDSKRWRRFNEGLCGILGYPRERLNTMTWAELTHPDDLEADTALFEQVMRGERDGYGMDKRFVRGDGTVIDAYIDVKAIRKSGGGVDYFIAMVQDISDRKEQQRRLEAAMQQAQHYLDIAGVMIVSLDREGRIRLLNRRACEVLGYAEEELLGRDWFECCLPTANRTRVEEVFAQLMTGANESIDYFENPVKARDGGLRMIAWHTSLLRNADGAITGLLSSGEDVTLQREAENALEQSEQRLRTLVQTIPDLVWLKDADGVYLACNPQFERFFGAGEAEILGKTDYDFVDRDLADFFREHDRKAMAAGRPSRNEETFTFKSDGYRGIFETIKTPMLDSEGRLIGVLGIARDISERKRAQAHIERLSGLYATLSQTNQAIVRSRDPNELFREVCRNAVEFGGLCLANIVLIETAADTLRIEESYGQAKAYMQDLTLSLHPDSPYGRGPTGVAIREDRPVWCQDFLDDPTTATWHDRARQYGLRSAASLPIHQDGKVIGAFNIFADTVRFFDAAARELLEEMTVDIGFALDTFQLERERREAQERLELVIRGSNDAPWDWDLVNDRFWYSPQIWSLLGYEKAESERTSHLWRKLCHPDDLPQVDAGLNRLLTGEHERDGVECRFHRKDGHDIPVLIRGLASRDDTGRAVRLSGTVMDLTERKRTEEALRTQRDQLLESRQKMQEQLDELNRWYDLTVGREERILELKREINRLLEKLGEPSRYPSAEPGQPDAEDRQE